MFGSDWKSAKRVVTEEDSQFTTLQRWSDSVSQPSIKGEERFQSVMHSADDLKRSSV